MSQNDTLKIMTALVLTLFTTVAQAQTAQPFRACVDSELINMGVDPKMQNRWNPNLIAGKLQIIAVERCTQRMSSLNPRPNVQEAEILPASGAPVFEEAGGTEGIREI
jgi:hypothetical protein